MKVLMGIKTKMSLSVVLVVVSTLFHRVKQHLPCLLQSEFLTRPSVHNFQKSWSAMECVHLAVNAFCSTGSALFWHKRGVCEPGDSLLEKKFFFKEFSLAAASFSRSDRFSLVMFVQNLMSSRQLGVRSFSKFL